MSGDVGEVTERLENEPFMMEQRANIKFCYKLGETAMETREILVHV